MKQSTPFVRKALSILLPVMAVCSLQRVIGAQTPASVKRFVGACLSGDRVQIEQLLEQHGNSLLNTAIQQQVLSRTAQGDDVHYDATPLMAAAFGGHVAIARLLLARGAVVEYTRPHDRVAALHMSVQEGHAEVTSLLLEHGAAVDQPQEDDATPLHIATQNGHTQIVALLLQYGASGSRVRKDGTTPLIMAAYKGHFAVAQQLLKQLEGESAEHMSEIVNYARPDGVTALQVASQVGNRGVVRLLLGCGARVNVQDQQSVSPLYAAVLNGHELVFDLLVSRGADLRQRGPFGNTLLMAAAASGNAKLLEKLLDHPHIDLTAVNDKGENALMCAATQKNVALFPLLVDRGLLSVVSTSYNGSSVLLRACSYGSARVVDWLIEHGAHVNATWRGATPLMVAAEKGHASVVGLLLARGADRNIRMCRTVEQIASMNDIADYRAQEIAVLSHHPEGFSALDIAVLNRHADVVTLLEQMEAK